jgi:hypothetical protein
VPSISTLELKPAGSFCSSSVGGRWRRLASRPCRRAPLVEDQIEVGAQAIPAFLQRRDACIPGGNFEGDYPHRNGLLQIANPATN